MTSYCPFCGAEVDRDSIYCLNCGKKLPESHPSPKRVTSSWEASPPSPKFQPQQAYSPQYRSRPYHPRLKAPIAERLVALCIDNFLSSIGLACLCYGVWKDGIRDGQSFGKGLMNLRVIDYRTGEPATIGQSCIRNCLCGWLDTLCCYLVALVDGNGRRIGDQIAGTVVILDQ
ncbi:MAG: hypothetical protein EAX86_03970 [Candidatus Heimdallarchaeota archaeon]|nr:hypothetical protein [Candidatus Heimdallarchaeota archaeon]